MRNNKHLMITQNNRFIGLDLSQEHLCTRCCHTDRKQCWIFMMSERTTKPAHPLFKPFAANQKKALAVK